MDDYYALLGVETDASVDDIRGAYRDRKNGIDTTNASGRASAAQLNKAWNVLSDPYQRGRYDEQRAVAAETGELDDGDTAIEVSPNGTGAKGSGKDDRRARAQTAREARVAAQRKPTITPPEGTHFPRQKQRVIAMAIDLLVVVVIFLGIGWFGANALAKHQKPEVVDKINALQKQIDDQNKVKSDADKRVSADKKANDTAKQKTDQTASDAAKTQVTDLTKQRDDQYSKLNTYLLGGTALAFGLGLLYLAIPSALSGRTLGKKLQHLIVLRDDGSPLGWSGAFVRYGLVVLVTLALFTLLRLGPLAGVIVLFGVTMWMRNGNMQGLHDRIAHTIVVSDEKA
jgi:F0F1-type ATP synthase assembly protein I